MMEQRPTDYPRLKDYEPTRFMLETSHYDEEKADRAVRFIENLCHTKGKWAGHRFWLLPWQERIIRDVFGVVDDNGYRQFRTAYVEIPKKNGKSELAAAIALYLLYADHEPSAEVYGAAADRQQASIVFDVARRMVEMSPALLKRSKIMSAGKRLVNYSNAGFYQVLSAEVGCVAPETIIQLKDGSMKRADQVVAGDVILSFNGQIPLFDEVVSAREEEPAEMFCITTHHGRQITVTENHPFFRMERGYRMQDLTHQYDWAYASTLMTNDRVAVGLGWPYVMNPHSDITSQEAWALGAWAGDGDCTRFRFINPDSPVIAKLRTYLESIGSGLKSVFSTRQIQAGKDKYQAPVEHLITGQGKRRKSPGREWIRENYGQEVKCHDKVIPERVLKGGPQIWAAFLAGYFDTDGCITNPEKGNAAFICSVSNTMLVQLQLLLARLGINASHWRKLKLSVSGRPQLRRLWSLLSPYMVHQRKRERLEQIASKEIYCLQRASESDKIKSVIYVGKQKSISFEMRSTQTHCTNGLITHNTKHGLNVSGLVLDELHAQPNRNLVDVLTKGSGDARTQPFYFLITTAGTDRNSICYEYHSKASDILAGKRIDPSFYPVIFGLEDGDDWNDEKNWYKANPSLGQTIQIDRVRDAYREALQNPAEENVFRQLRLDQWVGSTVAWIPEHVYDQGAREINMEVLKGRDCYAGLDLSSTSDITAFVMVFPPRFEGDEYIIVPHFWLPRETLNLRVRRDHVPYDVWEKQGLFHVTEGNVVDYNFVRRTINDLGKQYHILEIGVDRWNATQLITDLAGDGFTMVPIGMGFKDMSPGMKDLYKLLLEGRVNHGGNPVLRWMAGNVVAEVDAAENIKPSKKRSTEKIDGIVALIMGLDRAVRHEQAGSVYDQPDRGLVIL